ncbi:MAG TPA: TVP38/TMEM64 family protein [Firmicutes bacterium]|nr:TVP38/TMEM64 family protein [Bacillota bacterium]
MLYRRVTVAFVLGLAVIVPLVSAPHLYRLFSSRSALEAFLEEAGPWAPLGFVLLNVLQIIAAPLPGNIIAVAGGYFFGFAYGFLLNLVSTVTGSLLVFQLSKRFGKPLVERFVGPKTSALLSKMTTKNGIRGIALVFLLPFVPDDALCFVVGLTPMSTRTFLILVLGFRTPSVLVSTLTGAGMINLSPAGWLIAAAAALVGLYVFWTKGEALQQWVLNIIDRYLAPLTRSPHNE